MEISAAKTGVNFKGEVVPQYDITLKYLSTSDCGNVSYRMFIDDQEVEQIVLPDYSWADDRGTWDRALSYAWREADRILKSQADKTFDHNYGLISGSYLFTNSQV